ncbi:hypothetical protein MHK_004072, partial [Candidatus Magnetomorum sp. HK-1]
MNSYSIALLSLESEKSAKAKLYLDRSRKKLIRIKNKDHYLPEIQIDYPETNIYTNTSHITIKGNAKDDTYITHLNIGRDTIPIDVSIKKIEFQRKYPIKQGKNLISITAQDIAGYTNMTNLLINVDKISPVISLDEPVIYNILNEKMILLNIFSSDDSG